MTFRRVSTALPQPRNPLLWQFPPPLAVSGLKTPSLGHFWLRAVDHHAVQAQCVTCLCIEQPERPESQGRGLWHCVIPLVLSETLSLSQSHHNFPDVSRMHRKKNPYFHNLVKFTWWKIIEKKNFMKQCSVADNCSSFRSQEYELQHSS